MSKGYADHLLDMARHLDREFQREAEGVEVPLFKEKYEDWLQAQTDLAEGTKANYLHWLLKADDWICDLERDFYLLLKKAWTASDFDRVKSLCAEYDGLLVKEKEQAREEGKEQFGESAREIGNWVSSFRKYSIFLEECMQKAESDKIALAEMIKNSRISADHLFLSFRFILWGISRGLKETTMESMVSYIRRVNRELFSKTGHDLLREYLPGYVKTRNAAKINEMFSAMDGKLTERISDCDETEMPCKSLENARSALRNYAEFIKSLIEKAD